MGPAVRCAGWRAPVGAAVLVGALAACGEQQHPVVPRSTSPSPSLGAAPADGWDHYVADVETSVRGGPASGADKVGARGTFAYQVERTRGKEGAWSTRITLTKVPELRSVGGERAGHSPVGMRLEIDEEAGELRVFDAKGNRVQGDIPPEAASAIGIERARTAAEKRAGRQFPQRGARPAARSTPAAHRDAWLDNIVITGAARARLAQHRQQVLGRPVERIRGLDRYVVQKPNELREVLVDPALGAVVEENVVAGGKLVRRMAHSYEKREGGMFVKSKTQIEQLVAPDDVEPIVITQTFRNVRLERKGGN
ncbi:MAG: hypothetical protein H0X64_03280 [Gemmatimonadaceae bacterium]|nr:hypothetical protein [Gemmatimonadaceae bacterium]